VVKAMLGALLLLGLAAAAPAREDGPAPAAPVFETSVKPFLTKTCYVCHNARLKNGGLDLEGSATPAAIAGDPRTWEKVALKLRTGEMPPKELPRPSEEEQAAVVRWIGEELARADQAAPPDAGRVTARRLNRTEYNNTVHDLLGVSVRPADDFPQDDSGYGFDNIGDVLSLSPVLMEKYLAAAEKVAQAALLGPPESKPSLVRLQPRGGKIEPSPTPLFDYDLDGLSTPNALNVTHRVPADAEYKIRVVLGGSRPAGSEPLQVGLWVDGRKVNVLELDPEGGAAFEEDRQELSGKAREFPVRLSAGEHWLAASILRMYEGLPPSYAGPSPSRRPEPPPRQFKPPKDATPEKIEELRKKFEARKVEKPPANEARVSRLEVVGPFDAARGPSAESVRRVYACGHLHGSHSSGCARTILTRLAHRAFRRPVTSSDVDPLLRLVSAARTRGDSFEQALSLGLQAILVSPDFLFRIEKDAQAAGPLPGAPVTEHELASRLSYFLWASMPDDELLRCADQGTLRRPAVLAGQVRRMLKDEKAVSLVEAFGGQWLQVRALESISPDRERYPAFDNNLRLSMRRETDLFFESIVREDRSILDFIDGKYSFLNERLARHYGLTGVTGPEFRRVDLGDARRGGVLTQASVLTVSSYPTRTSTVLRGKWVLENLLGAPPPDPPAGTPRLDETTVGASASLRQQMEAHRTNQTCASCHARMDPIGFGLENYDGIGAWRTVDGKFAIDASGALPDGRSFEGPAGLKTILSADRDAFAECLTEKLLTYALGRGLERYDKRTVRAIAERLAASDYRFSALVLEIVNSLPFQMRKDRGSGRS
jgi:mono/diheme cytochrome c family protein